MRSLVQMSFMGVLSPCAISNLCSPPVSVCGNPPATDAAPYLTAPRSESTDFYDAATHPFWCSDPLTGHGAHGQV